MAKPGKTTVAKRVQAISQPGIEAAPRRPTTVATTLRPAARGS